MPHMPPEWRFVGLALLAIALGGAVLMYVAHH